MDRYVAFLRGMNLGGRRITNEELRGHFERMGMAEVATFRASGNVVFDTGSGESKLVAASKGKLQVSLLIKAPAAAIRKRVLKLASEEDRMNNVVRNYC